MDETLDIINEDEEVLAHASKLEIHRKHLLHKAVHILIIDSLGRIYCRNKTPEQSAAGGWTSSVGIHVLSRQSFGQAAKKALQDVLSINCPLILIGKARINSETENEIAAVYIGYSDKVKPNPALKASGRLFTIEDLKFLLENEKATPHLLEALNLYLKNN